MKPRTIDKNPKPAPKPRGSLAPMYASASSVVDHGSRSERPLREIQPLADLGDQNRKPLHCLCVLRASVVNHHLRPFTLFMNVHAILKGGGGCLRDPHRLLCGLLFPMQDFRTPNSKPAIGWGDAVEPPSFYRTVLLPRIRWLALGTKSDQLRTSHFQLRALHLPPPVHTISTLFYALPRYIFWRKGRQMFHSPAVYHFPVLHGPFSELPHLQFNFQPSPDCVRPGETH